jgi:hypothetical protein
VIENIGWRVMGNHCRPSFQWDKRYKISLRFNNRMPVTNNELDLTGKHYFRYLLRFGEKAALRSNKKQFFFYLRKYSDNIDRQTANNRQPENEN